MQRDPQKTNVAFQDSDTLSSKEKSGRRIRPQISLAVLLCLITIFALGMSQYLTNQKYDRLKSQMDIFKKEFDIIDVIDPTLVHATPSKQRLPSEFSFRLYLPPDKKYVLYYAIDGIPQTGIPDANGNGVGWGKIEMPNELYNEIKNTNSVSIQMWESRVYIRTETTTVTMPLEIGNRKDHKRHVATYEGVESQTVAPAGQPLVLVRFREQYGSGGSLSSDKMPDPSMGVMLWIEEETSPSATFPNALPKATENK